MQGLVMESVAICSPTGAAQGTHLDSVNSYAVKNQMSVIEPSTHTYPVNKFENPSLLASAATALMEGRLLNIYTTPSAI